MGAVVKIPTITAACPFYGVNFQLADPSTLPATKAVEVGRNIPGPSLTL